MRYFHIRIRNPKLFKPKTFRTHDIGRGKHSKRVAGILRKNSKWATQKYLISKTDANVIDRKLVGKKSTTKRMLSQIKARYGNIIYVGPNEFRTRGKK